MSLKFQQSSHFLHSSGIEKILPLTIIFLSLAPYDILQRTDFKRDRDEIDLEFDEGGNFSSRGSRSFVQGSRTV